MFYPQSTSAVSSGRMGDGAATHLIVKVPHTSIHRFYCLIYIVFSLILQRYVHRVHPLRRKSAFGGFPMRPVTLSWRWKGENFMPTALSLRITLPCLAECSSLTSERKSRTKCPYLERVTMRWRPSSPFCIHRVPPLQA